MGFKGSPCLWNTDLGRRGKAGESRGFPLALAACSAVRVFPAQGETSLLSTLQMFPVPQSRHHVKTELLGTDLSGYILPWVLFHWLGFMAGSIGETRMFLFSLLKNTETVIYSTSVSDCSQQEWAEWGGGQASRRRRHLALS